MSASLEELARACACVREGPPDLVITEAAPYEAAGPQSLIFALNDQLLEQAEASGAAAIIVPVEGRRPDRPCLRATNVRVAWARALEILYPPPPLTPGVHPTSVVDPSAEIDPSVFIDAFVVIGPGVRIGARCRIGPGAAIAANVEVGNDSTLHAHVTLFERTIIGERNVIGAGAVIGSEGFGFAHDGRTYRRIRHIGRVRTGCDVEIGANTTIDRAALGETLIGDGVKIDNLVMIAHNVTIGSHTVMAAQVGIAGSARIGSCVTMGGQAGVGDHLVIGDGATLTGGAGAIGDVTPGAVVMGFPARPRRQFLRSAATLAKLPEIIRSLPTRVKESAEDPE
ncbi:MAG TPA: UDP-3-O-(3-hydroxymyristoyl)glucosamine N-acyltransferase [Armatimonadota bacterium]|nr:UDP-3-O-(3-hydroxymyristoyl)glucosamine N-acyltransferase [Armatimonadota bacterium]